jgi:glycosyltransferase involved in cell wall biosynthesis
MMATGGVAVVSPNEGNMEYLIDGENCLFYEQGNIDNAITKIELICKNRDLRDKLIINGQKTADSRSWSKIKDQILELYDYQTTPERNGEKDEACNN